LEFKDYYKILGVSPDADIKSIKKAYQKLTKKYHPDLNPGNKETEEKFKEINEAYHAISDPVKRKKYDDLRESYLQWQKRGGSGKNFDWSAWQHDPGSGTYTRTMTPEEFEAIFGGTSGLGEGFSGFSDFFATIFGMDLDFDSPYTSPAEDYYEAFRQPRAGRDIEGEISVTLEDVYYGTKKLISIGGKKIEASIPKGIQDGNIIRLAGQGREGSRGGPKGDLLLTVKIQPHARYTRRGNDLYTDLEIDFYTAALGGEAKINTLAGEIMLKIPSQTQAGKSFRLKGKGMPVLNQTGKFGDLYAKISIILPSDLTEKEISVLKELYSSRQSKK